jgi:hypothetical protein
MPPRKARSAANRMGTDRASARTDIGYGCKNENGSYFQLWRCDESAVLRYLKSGKLWELIPRAFVFNQ